ncbi:MAG TPA: peptidoglycan DD-metalloendopeptidase family protein [Rubrobacter sp.]|nr:peptidoglycan DD-metalloendopeptidase family protein [Rubrobacter sp.]
MGRFGWMRLACLFFVLTILTGLIRLSDTGAEARSLSARVPDAMSIAPERPEGPAVTRWTEAQLSSLEDVSEDALRAEDAPRTAAVRPPAPDEAGQEPPAREEARAVSPSEPPVFYRPAGPGKSAGSGPECGDLRGAPEGGRIVFPLERRFFFSYEDTWGAPRAQGGHEGTDLMTPSGVPEYAITDGTVVPVAGSDADGWNTLGGHAVMVRADRSIGPVKAGDLFYYAHLERQSPLRIGDRVNAGQVVGYAGDTGQGPPGTSGLFPPHLHLGWYDGTGGREEAGSGAMNPYPLLEWIKSNGGAVTGGSDARFCEAPRTGPLIPSAHDGAWPTPPNPRLSPDLDTTPKDPKPDRGAREADRDEATPAKKPTDPDRPKKSRNDRPQKRPKGDRPEAPKPDRPDKDRQRPTRPDPRPDPSEDQHIPPKPEPPEKDPPQPAPPSEGPPGQYDPSTGEPAGSAEAPRPTANREPKTYAQHDANNDGGD